MSNDDIRLELEGVVGKIDFLLQEGVILTEHEKEQMTRTANQLLNMLYDFEVEK